MEVLVVDDEPIARRTIEKVLSTGGYQVRTASNGRDGLSHLQEHNIQLVVMDWEMPIMNGIDFCQAVRSEVSSQYVYILMVTSRGRPDDTVHGLTMGADDYLTKPFNPSELLLRVHTGHRMVGMASCEMTIFALAKLAESRDPDSGAHLERVRSYCRMLAMRLRQNSRYSQEVDDNYVRLLYQTSPLHDIGKVAIPDSILLKPGRLTTEEFEVMKTHTVRGTETLESLLHQFPNAGFLQMARDITLSHHEKFDGSGYPLGLAGTQIPLCGRILAVADVYDALTSKRVYKDAFSHGTAKATIEEGAGKHFDPNIVRAFLELEADFIRIQEVHRDAEYRAGQAAGTLHLPLPASTLPSAVEGK